MQGKLYSQRLGVISDEQFQAALDRFNMCRLISFSESFLFACFLSILKKRYSPFGTGSSIERNNDGFSNKLPYPLFD
jgi:hypothetical protein